MFDLLVTGLGAVVIGDAGVGEVDGDAFGGDGVARFCESEGDDNVGVVGVDRCGEEAGGAVERDGQYVADDAAIGMPELGQASYELAARVDGCSGEGFEPGDEHDRLVVSASVHVLSLSCARACWWVCARTHARSASSSARLRVGITRTAPVG